MKVQGFFAAALVLLLARSGLAQRSGPTTSDDAEQRMARIRQLADRPQQAEVENALIWSLRADPAPSVRREAAQTLGRLTWCTKKTIAALYFAATGCSIDGGPSERSPTVQAAAVQALEVCVCRPVDERGIPESAGGQLPPTGLTLAAYYTDDIVHQETAQIMEQIYHFLAETISTNPGQPVGGANPEAAVLPCTLNRNIAPPVVPLRTMQPVSWPILPAVPSRALGPPW